MTKGSSHSMYTRRVKRVFLFAACFLLAVSAVRADSVRPPCSYITYSADRAFAFVMLAPQRPEECVGYSSDEVAERKALRSRFRSSGMYEKGDPGRLKWAVDGDWFAYEVLVPNDGESIVRMGPWASNFTDEAFSFIRNGDLVRKVAIDELVKDKGSVSRTVSHFSWSSKFGLTSDGSRFYVSTLEGADYEFDVKTGEMLSSTPPKTAANSPSESDSSNAGSTDSSKDASKRTCSFALFFIAALAFFGRSLANSLLP